MRALQSRNFYKLTLDSADKKDMELSAIALQGLQQATAQFEASAARPASVGAATPEGAPVDTVNLSEAIVALLTAENQFTANIGVLKTAGEMQTHILDLLA
jgi:hypothetical protein